MTRALVMLTQVIGGGGEGGRKQQERRRRRQPQAEIGDRYRHYVAACSTLYFEQASPNSGTPRTPPALRVRQPRKGFFIARRLWDTYGGVQHRIISEHSRRDYCCSSFIVTRPQGGREFEASKLRALEGCPVFRHDDTLAARQSRQPQPALEARLRTQYGTNLMKSRTSNSHHRDYYPALFRSGPNRLMDFLFYVPAPSRPFKVLENAVE